MSELKPCPFCGKEQMTDEERGDSNNPYTGGTRLCDTHNCNAVSRNWNNRPIEDALRARIARLEEKITDLNVDLAQASMNAYNSESNVIKLSARIAELEARITELSQAVGLITTLKPTMVMDANHPLDMVREVAEHVTARIAELEAATRWIPVQERLPESGAFVLVTDGDEVKTARHADIVRQWETSDALYYHGLGYGHFTHWMPLPQPPEVQECRAASIQSRQEEKRKRRLN